MASLMPFHLAITVDDLATARQFYTEILACGAGRSGEGWACFDFFDHLLVLHQAPKMACQNEAQSLGADSGKLPIPNFGVFLAWEDWEALAEHLRAREVTFIVEPHVRHQGEAAEQASMLLLDPAGNALGFRALRNMDQIFGDDGEV